MKRLMKPTKNALRKVRHQRVRARVIGSQEKPRLSVFRSLRGMNVQIIDDSTGKTLCAVSHSEVKGKKVDKKVGQSAMIGEMIAQKAKAKGVTKVVFDRGGYQYHGRVKALADAARAGGLQF